VVEPLAVAIHGEKDSPMVPLILAQPLPAPRQHDELLNLIAFLQFARCCRPTSVDRRAMQ
jgi:hypothetical protein